jgi:hypothetical protein
VRKEGRKGGRKEGRKKEGQKKEGRKYCKDVRARCLKTMR